MIAGRANVTTTPGAISRSTVLSPRAATVPWMPLVVITGVPMVSDSWRACAWACIRLRCRAGSTKSTTANRASRTIGKRSTTGVPLYRGQCSAVGCGPVPARSGTSVA